MIAPGIELRPYQRDALQAVRMARNAGVRRMVVVAPTGAGKTVIFSHLAEALGLGRDEKILILAHRDELVSQARVKYLAANPGEMVGLEKAENRATPMDRVAVASVQSLRGGRLQDFLQRFGRPSLVVTDEVHHATASGYQAIYDAIGIEPGGDVVHVGVTATPKRSDGVGLHGTFETVAYSIALGDLIDQKYLVPLVGYRVNTQTNLDAVRTTAGDFNAGDLSDAVDTDERNARVVGAYADIVPHKKALVFAASVAHSQSLRDAFDAAGYRAAHVDGTTPIDERRALLTAYGRGDYEVMVNCAVLTEGYDEPSIECVIIARPTKSPVLAAQMVGRATRLHPGKTHATVIDMVDVTKRHSIVSLPTLFGLPANFDLKGKSASDVSKAFAKLATESPEVAGMISDSGTLDAMLQRRPDQRVREMIGQLLEKARKTQSYVDVDLLRPPALSDDVRGQTRLAWAQPTEDTYRLRLHDDAVTIRGDVVGNHSVVVNYKQNDASCEKSLGTFADLRDAFAVSEDWLLRRNPESAVLVDRNAHWRQAPASEKQVAALLRCRVAHPERLSRGDASAMLDMLLGNKIASRPRPIPVSA